MLFVLAGPSYVGKKTAISHFVKLYSFSSIVPYTTKTKTPEETDGIQYHFVARAFFDTHADDFIFDKPFDCSERRDDDIYGYNKEHLKTAIMSYSNFIIHASVNNAIKIAKEFKSENSNELFIIFLDYASQLNEEFFKSKVKRQITDDVLNKRFLHAQKERRTYNDNKKHFDTCLNADDPYDIVIRIEDYILPLLQVMPTVPDKIPGPLSGEDIIRMAFRRRTDKLLVKIKNKPLIEPELKSLLSGCGLHITLNSSIRKTRKNSWNNYIDMAANEQDITKKLIYLYPETSISEGYVLAPHEMILCTSNEYLEIPVDVYAIASSRFSYSQLGLTIELGTSIIQAGHKGQIHFQIMNNTENYVCIYPNIAIAQLVFFRTIHPSVRAYSDYEDSHQYDKKTIPPPLSKFRDRNSALDSVTRSVKNTSIPFMEKAKKILVNKILPYFAVGLFLMAIVYAGFAHLLPEETITKLKPLLEDIKIEVDISLFELLLLVICLEVFHELVHALWKGIMHLCRKIKLYTISRKE